MYSINILYFDIGEGEDYVYHGRMDFIGIHHNDKLSLGWAQKKKFTKDYPSDIFPEVYLIKVNNFDDIAKTPLDEWIYFLKNTDLPKEYSAKGLNQLNEKLNYDKMDATTKQQYDEYLTNVRISNSALETASLKGKHEGRKEGRKEGRQEERENLIIKMFDLGQKIKLISKITEMSESEIIHILKENDKKVL